VTGSASDRRLWRRSLLRDMLSDGEIFILSEKDYAVICNSGGKSRYFSVR